MADVLGGARRGAAAAIHPAVGSGLARRAALVTSRAKASEQRLGPTPGEHEQTTLTQVASIASCFAILYGFCHSIVICSWEMSVLCLVFPWPHVAVA